MNIKLDKYKYENKSKTSDGPRPNILFSRALSRFDTLQRRDRLVDTLTIIIQ